jgi:hypothetical protein
MKKTAKKPTKKATKSAKPKAEPVISSFEPAVETPEVLEVPVIGLAINPRYVYAGLDGNRIAVEVPAKLSPKLLKKTITVKKKLDSDTYELHHGN